MSTIGAQLGWQRRVSAYELVLLLVTGTVIVEAPLIIRILPELLQVPLLIVAFLAPALVALTLDAPPLNAEPRDRPLRCYLTLGVLCMGYGLLCAMTLTVDEPLVVVRGMAEIFNGVAALPFAVMLIAVMSASRQRQAVAGT